MKTLFLDKNPIFHYAHREMFGETAHWADVRLIEKIKNREITVNIDCTSVFAIYNHIVYKLRREKGNQLEDAQKISRQYIKELFKSESWIIHGLDRDHIFKAINDNTFDLENAWQFYGAQKSSSELFITWNIKHFKNGMNPKDFFIKFFPKDRK